jgi:hypothetical protein
LRVFKRVLVLAPRRFNTVRFNTVRGFLHVQKAKGFGAVIKAGTSEKLRGVNGKNQSI